MKNFYQCFREHEGYLSLKWEQYLFIYQEILQSLLEKGEPVNILEIGVANGGSLEIWKRYLPENSCIYGIDIDEKCTNLKFSHNIFFKKGSANDKAFLNKEFNDIKFDVIIDDGSHLCSDVIESFNILFKEKLKNGGVYIIEDLLTSYIKSFGGGYRKKTSSIEFLKNLVDALYVNHFRKIPFYKKKETKALKELHPFIKKVSFYECVCVIEKYCEKKEDKFIELRVGEKAPVCDWSIKHIDAYKDIKEKIEATKKLFVK